MSDHEALTEALLNTEEWGGMEAVVLAWSEEHGWSEEQTDSLLTALAGIEDADDLPGVVQNHYPA